MELFTRCSRSSQEESYDDREIIYSDCDDIGAAELIFDENIPFGTEEVVTIVEETIESFTSSNGVSSQQHPRSILLPKSEPKFKQTLTVNRSLLKTNQHQLKAQASFESAKSSPLPSSSSKPQPSKFRQTVNFKPTNFVLNAHTMKIFKNKIKAIQKKKAQAMARESKQRPKKLKKIKPIVVKKMSLPKKAAPVNYIPQKPKPIVDPKNSGEIIRVLKGDSDIEVDILSNSEEDFEIDQLAPTYNEADESSNEISVDDSWTADNSHTQEVDSVQTDDIDSNLQSEDTETMRKIQELADNDEETFILLNSCDIPQAEVILEASHISELEKFVHSEYFMQRPTKTPERYLKIRNHIINQWNQCKPNFLSKTLSRNGLKNCGDVNCISRIHSLLEQTGVINFGCPEVNWIRPLKILYELFQQNIKNKHQNSRLGPSEKKQRIRNFSASAHDANFTISHDGDDTISSDSMINRIKSRTMHRTQFELVKCQQFSKEIAAPFQVSINLSCLFCLYFHALSSKLEIMGFLGGKCIGQNHLSLTRYKPCRTSNQTAINCEMCPVSQVEQSCKLVDEGCELLGKSDFLNLNFIHSIAFFKGWFHSHPSFPPIPSRTDLKTQAEMQLQFASNNPFIGFILSCVDMEFK